SPVVVEIPDASTTSVLELAARVKDASAGSQRPSTTALPAVILAAEGLYTPASLPSTSTVIVVGKPHKVVSSAGASAVLNQALNELVGGGSGSGGGVVESAASVLDVSVIGESPANAAFAGKVKALLSNPELLMF
ncbi:hypothetical protein IWW38_006044, partial [Coemansia aciculifera]